MNCGHSGDVHLAGQLWLPAEHPRGALLIVPGSGPSDRHNDVFFPPIREHLLGNGIAVSSFDKRRVGGSTGDWLTAGIVEQADDTIAAFEVLKRSHDLADGPIGLFGHSQGGWVVLDAAAREGEVAFVVTSSGPGVSPAQQERHAAADGLRRAGLASAEIESALLSYDDARVNP
ncbi:MAG: alpha/beta fold hydrolase [Candidatus Limnocylindria bacterium]